MPGPQSTRKPIIPRENTFKNNPGAAPSREAQAAQARKEADFDLPPEQEAYYDPDVQEGLERQRSTGKGEPLPKVPRPRSRRPGGRRRTSSRPSPRPSSRKLSSPNQPTLRKPLGQRVAVGTGEGLAGIMLGAIVYAVLLSVVEYGKAGPGMWFRAKFMNQVGTPPSGSQQPPTSKATPQPSGGGGFTLPIVPFVPGVPGIHIEPAWV